MTTGDLSRQLFKINPSHSTTLTHKRCADGWPVRLTSGVGTWGWEHGGGVCTVRGVDGLGG